MYVLLHKWFCVRAPEHKFFGSFCHFVFLSAINFVISNLKHYTNQNEYYTNHTLLPEALESWGEDLFSKLLPRHLQIVDRIDDAHAKANPSRSSSVRDHGQVKMGELSFIMAHKVNGVSALHSELVKETVFEDLHKIHPTRIINQTNGITPRRWLYTCNQPLSDLVTREIGDGWVADLEQLKALNEKSGDKAFLAEFQAAKRANKVQLAQWIRQTCGTEVNPDAIDGYTAKNIIANPNCSTAQLVVALKPLHDAAGIKRVVVSTYQSVSGAGKEGMDELFQQSRAIFVGDPVEPAKFTKQIAFNVIPHIDVFMDSGDTKEEWKMMVETKKIVDPKIKVTATCVRVPVFVGHAESINIEFEEHLDENEARDILREAPGIMVIDKREDGGYVTPVECAGDFATFISRIRQDSTIDNGLNLWCVSDNLRKGAALNAVQIAELLGREVLKKG